MKSSARTGSRPRPARSRPLPLATRRQVADLFKRNPRTISTWVAEGMPVARMGRGGKPALFNLTACIKWCLARELDSETVEGISPEIERAMLDRRRREELEGKIHDRRAGLMERADVEATYLDLSDRVVRRLHALPDQVLDDVTAAAAAGPASVKTVLLARIDDALRELAAGWGAPVDQSGAESERSPA